MVIRCVAVQARVEGGEYGHWRKVCEGGYQRGAEFSRVTALGKLFLNLLVWEWRALKCLCYVSRPVCVPLGGVYSSAYKEIRRATPVRALYKETA